jgi:uncharacterized membrane protein YcaP (DUF421 family)
VAACRWDWFRKLVTASPTVLYHDGIFLESELRRERVTRAEIKATVHEKGIQNMAAVSTVILGSNGQFSVLMKVPAQITAHGDSQSV